ncbi:MAG: hypothetical protein K8H87_16425 [Pseudorhodoplanes sp.]|nr:hypothetical protein [Pseudorhodoplanes sp.]
MKVSDLIAGLSHYPSDALVIWTDGKDTQQLRPLDFEHAVIFSNIISVDNHPVSIVLIGGSGAKLWGEMPMVIQGPPDDYTDQLKRAMFVYLSK